MVILYTITRNVNVLFMWLTFNVCKPGVYIYIYIYIYIVQRYKGVYIVQGNKRQLNLSTTRTPIWHELDVRVCVC